MNYDFGRLNDNTDYTQQQHPALYNVFVTHYHLLREYRAIWRMFSTYILNNKREIHAMNATRYYIYRIFITHHTAFENITFNVLTVTVTK